MKRPKKNYQSKKVDLADLSLESGRKERSLFARTNARKTGDKDKILKERQKRYDELKCWWVSK